MPGSDTVDYLEHLGDGDLRFIARALAGEKGADDFVYNLRADRGALERALSDRSLWERLFVRAARDDPFVLASPFLVFAVIVHRSGAELARASYIEEPVGPGRRIPVFDVASLLAFLEDAGRRLFLIELLASFTHVASGSIMVRSRRGYRRQRFSELDPVRMASLLEVVPEAERPGLFRRLGDVSLFLTGVFPDRNLSATMGPIARQRLLRTIGGLEEGSAALDDDPLDGRSLLEDLGRRWYLLAVSSAPSPPTQKLQLTQSVAERFVDARRILNFITDGYLFPHRGRWFPQSN